MGMSNLDGYHPNKNESYQLGYQQGRADERAKMVDELWQTLCKYKQDINDANYGFNFVEIAFNEVKNKYNA